MCQSLKHLLEGRLHGGPEENTGGFGADILLRGHLYLPVRILFREGFVYDDPADSPIPEGRRRDGGPGRIVLSRDRRRGDGDFIRNLRICRRILLRRNERLLRDGGILRLVSFRRLHGRFRINLFVSLVLLGRRSRLDRFLRFSRLLFRFLLCGDDRLFRVFRSGSLFFGIGLAGRYRLFRRFRIGGLFLRVCLPGNDRIGRVIGIIRIYGGILGIVLSRTTFLCE